MKTSSKFTDLFNREEYYIGGAESNYVDYRQKDYTTLAADIIKILKLDYESMVLDYGCGLGNLVKALDAHCVIVGTDISEWAITNGRGFNNLKDYDLIHYSKQILSAVFDYILFLDVLEHCELSELNDIMHRCLLNDNIKSILVRIPVARHNSNEFVLECSKKDKTHIQCHDKVWWYRFFMDCGFEIADVIHEEKIYDSEGVLVWTLKRRGGIDES